MPKEEFKKETSNLRPSCIEIKSVFGDVIFEFEKEYNTIKDTLLEAVKIWLHLADVKIVRI